MNHVIAAFLEKYNLQTQEDYETAIKEIIHHLTLLGLWRSKFFEYAAFYGGTALRVFYGLRRFSEDLDFSLLKNEETFDIRPHLNAVEAEIASYGFAFSVEKKNKTFDSQIESAFIKGNTRFNLLCIEVKENIVKGFNRDRIIKVKLEIDIDPPPGAEFEVKTLLSPIPFSVRLFTRPDLFAGKMHAVLCRQWKSRVKGRDFYDLLWYVGQRIPCRLDYLKEKMIQTGHWQKEQTLNKTILMELLQKKFKETDFLLAKKDVFPFIGDKHELALWSQDFFLSIIDEIQLL